MCFIFALESKPSVEGTSLVGQSGWTQTGSVQWGWRRMHKSLHQRFRDCIPVCSLMGCNITQVLSGLWELQTNYHGMFSVLVRLCLTALFTCNVERCQSTWIIIWKYLTLMISSWQPWTVSHYHQLCNIVWLESPLLWTCASNLADSTQTQNFQWAHFPKIPLPPFSSVLTARLGIFR